MNKKSKPNANKNIRTYLFCLKKIVNSIDKKCNVSFCTKPVQRKTALCNGFFITLCNNDFEIC